MQLMYQQFDPFLYLFIGGAFPKMFEVGNDGFAKGNDLFAHAIVHILVRIIDEVEEG